MFLLWTKQRTVETSVVECGRNFVVVLAIIDDDGVGGVVHESRHKWGVVERNFFRGFLQKVCKRKSTDRGREKRVTNTWDLLIVISLVGVLVGEAMVSKGCLWHEVVLQRVVRPTVTSHARYTRES